MALYCPGIKTGRTLVILDGSCLEWDPRSFETGTLSTSPGCLLVGLVSLTQPSSHKVLSVGSDVKKRWGQS